MKTRVIYKDLDGAYMWREVDVADVQPSAEELQAQKLTEIEQLKSQLSESDYKVVKLAECLAIGGEMPYNAQELHKQRQSIRDRINQLEKEVADES